MNDQVPAASEQDDRRSDNPVDKPFTRRRFLEMAGGAAVATTLPTILSGCGGGESANEITIGLAQNFSNLDLTHGLVSLPVLSNCLEGMLNFDVNGKLIPALATDWKQVDPVTYVYQLRKGVKFWDGSVLTADDVVASMNQHRDPKVASQFAYAYDGVDSIKATGPLEVTITLNAPNNYFRYTPVTGQGGFVIQRRFLEQHAHDIGRPGVLTMGTGPYRIGEYAPDDHITLVRNEHYWGSKPPIKRVIIRPITDPSTRLLAMRSGQINLADHISSDTYRNYARLSHVDIAAGPPTNLGFIFMDTQQKPWSDIHVRRAVAHCVDRQGMVNAILAGRGEPATTIEPPNMWANVASEAVVKKIYASLPTYDFDIGAARRELAQSAFPNGFQATAKYGSDKQTAGKALQAVSSNLRQIGVDLRVQELNQGEFTAQNLAHKDLGLRATTFPPDFPDPGDNTYYMLSGSFAVKDQYNFANYRNDEVTRLLKRQLTTTDTQTRIEDLTRVMTIAAEEVPYVTLWWEYEDAAIDDKFQYRNSSWYPTGPWVARIRPA